MYMDPNTGLMIDGDPPEPATGMADAQDKIAASAPELPAAAPSAPDVADVTPPVPESPTDVTAPPAPIAPVAGQEPTLPPIPGSPVGLPLAADMPGSDQAPEGLTAPIVPPSMNEEPPKPVTPATTPSELTAQQIEGRRQQGIDEAKDAEFKAKAAADTVKLKIDQEKQRQEIVKKGEADFAAARARQDSEYNRYRAMGEKDVWGDNGTMNRVLAGVAIILTGRAGANFIIGAVNGLEQNKKAELARQEKAMEASGKDASEIAANTRQKLSDFSLQAAAGLDAVAARLDADLAARGVPITQRKTNTDILAIQAQANEARRKAEVETHKEAEQKIKDDLAQHKSTSDIALAEARTRESEARTRELDRRPVKGAATGKGGKGLKERAADRADERLDSSEAAALNTEMKEATKDVTEKGGLAEAQQHLDSSLRKLNAGAENPVEWTNAIDAAIRTNTGRAAIRAQYDLYVKHAGGAPAKFENWLQEAKDGNIGASYKKNLLGSFNSSLAELQREGGEREKNFRENYQNDPRLKNNPIALAAFQAHHKNVFGKLHGGDTIGPQGTSVASAVTAAAPVPAKAGPTLEEKKAAAKRVAEDSTAPSTSRAAAKKFLIDNP